MTERIPRLRRILQITLAAVGGAIAALGLVGLATVPFLIDDDFAGGLAILVFGVYGLGGFVLLAAGLLIPQPANAGIQFTPRQRTLLTWGVVGPVLTSLGYVIGSNVLPPLGGVWQTVTIGLFVGLLLSGPLATVTTLGSKFRTRMSSSTEE